MNEYLKIGIISCCVALIVYFAVFIKFWFF